MSGDSFSLNLPLARFATDSCEATALYRELRKPLLRYLAGLGLSSEEAQDVVQDAFLSMHKHLAAGGSQENIRSWLFRVAHKRPNNSRKMPVDRTTFTDSTVESTTGDRSARDTANLPTSSGSSA